MGAKLLLDHGLPRSCASLLRARGIDTIHVADARLPSNADEAILACAEQENRVVVTMDADFHSLLAAAGATHPSVIRLRVEGLKGPALAELVMTILRVVEADLLSGAAVSSDGRRVRVRRLPVGRGAG